MSNLDNLIEVLDLQNIPQSIIATMVNSPNSFYRKFSIPKRKGGIREIHAPYPSLDYIQKKIHTLLKSKFHQHTSSYAYVPGRNAILHAENHVNSPELLTLDIYDFFGSIKKESIYKCLSKTNIDKTTISYISSLCCLNDSLPQGAPTSPILSNIVFSRVDDRLSSLSKKLGLTYSRYADDLAFSGEKIPLKLIDYISNILQSAGFELNNNKTILKRKGAKKIITGISISSGALKAPKKYKRDLRKQIFLLEKNIDNISMLSPLDPLIFERLLGRINYVIQIEPQNSYYQKKKIILSEYHQRFLGKR